MVSSFMLVPVLVLFLYYLYKRKKFIATLPPGPLSLPIFGNIFQIDRTDPRRTFYQWYKKYGPIYTVWLGMDPHVMVCTKEMMEETFVKRAEEFSERPFYWTFDLFTHGQFGIVHNYGEPWKIQRPFADRVLKNFELNKNVIESAVSDEAGKLIKILEKKLISTKSGILNLKPDLERCIADTVSTLFTGRSLSGDEVRYRTLLENIEKTSQLFRKLRMYFLNKFFVLRFLPFFNHFGFDDLCALNSQYLNMILEELEVSKKRYNGTTVDKATDFTSAYLAELRARNYDSEERSQWSPFNDFSDWQLICILSEIWPAAIHPTLATLQWALLFMIMNPDVQRKVQNEIDSTIGTERQPKSDDQYKMPYTVATLYEIQRCANVFPINVPHSVATETKLYGYSIPAKIAVVPQIAVFHMDETIYDAPSEFRPERFLASNGKSLKTDTALPMPFSLGSRVCLGQNLARTQLFVIFVSLMQKFTFSRQENQPKPCLNPKCAFIFEPQPFDLVAKLRNG